MWRAWRGSGRPVVFVHGWPLDHRDEAATHDAVFAAAGCARLYLDLPGMGRSAGEAVPRDLEGYLGALLALVETELGGDPFLLAGTSTGAYLAAGMAARLGPQVEGLLLRAPMTVPEDRRRALPEAGALREDAALMAGLPAGERALLDAPPLVQTRPWVAALVGKLGSTVLPVIAAADHARLDPVRGDPARYRLAEDPFAAPFPRPALVVLGRQDAQVGWRDGLARLAAWPRATLALLDAAGHELPLAPQAGLYAALVGDWLARLEAAP